MKSDRAYLRNLILCLEDDELLDLYEVITELLEDREERKKEKIHLLIYN